MPEGVLVETDVLRLRFDAFGDPAFAALRDHPVALDATDQPFVVLEQRDGFTYRRAAVWSERMGWTARGVGRALTLLNRYFAWLREPQSLRFRWSMRIWKGACEWRSATPTGGDHAIRVTYRVDNRGLRPILALYGQLKRSRPCAGAERKRHGPSIHVGAAFTTAESRYEKVDFDDLMKDPFP